MQLTDLLNKSQRYAECVLREHGWASYIIKRGENEPEDYNQYRVGLVIRNGRVESYKIG